jgi:7-cyano-7-deazaguanine synthase
LERNYEIHKEMKALIVYSGGMDSTVLLHQYKDSIKFAVSFNYGSKHNDIEIQHAKQNCELLGIEHRVVELSFINGLFNSSLLISGEEIPDGNYSEESMRSTVVPFRNGIFLSVAVGLAESEGVDTVLIANHFGDHAIYPDCTKTFINAFVKAAENGTYNRVLIRSPYCELTKRSIAIVGKEYGVDFSKTYSCYKGEELHCGVCATCIERKEALSGFDTTTYK